MNLFLLMLAGCPDPVQNQPTIDVINISSDEDGGILNLPPEQICTRNKLGEPFCYDVPKVEEAKPKDEYVPPKPNYGNPRRPLY